MTQLPRHRVTLRSERWPIFKLCGRKEKTSSATLTLSSTPEGAATSGSKPNTALKPGNDANELNFAGRPGQGVPPGGRQELWSLGQQGPVQEVDRTHFRASLPSVPCFTDSRVPRQLLTRTAEPALLLLFRRWRRCTASLNAAVPVSFPTRRTTMEPHEQKLKSDVLILSFLS